MKTNLLHLIGLKSTKVLERNPTAFFVSDRVKSKVLHAISEVEKDIEGRISEREYINGVIDAFIEHFKVDTDLN